MQNLFPLSCYSPFTFLPFWTAIPRSWRHFQLNGYSPGHLGQYLTTKASRSRGTNPIVSKAQRNSFIRFGQPFRVVGDTFSSTVIRLDKHSGHLGHALCRTFFICLAIHHSHSCHSGQPLRGVGDTFSSTVIRLDKHSGHLGQYLTTKAQRHKGILFFVLDSYSESLESLSVLHTPVLTSASC